MAEVQVTTEVVLTILLHHMTGNPRESQNQTSRLGRHPREPAKAKHGDPAFGAAQQGELQQATRSVIETEAYSSLHRAEAGLAAEVTTLVKEVHARVVVRRTRLQGMPARALARRVVDRAVHKSL